MVRITNPKKVERQDSLVQNVTWRHYVFFIIHMLQSVASSIGRPVLTQYLYAKTKREYFQEHNLTDVQTHRSMGRCFTNTSAPGYKLQQEVQAINAEWMQWFSLSHGFPSIIIIFITASWIDVLGRKIMIVLNMTGHMLMYVMYCLVMVLNLKTEFLLCGYIIEGLVGGHLLNILVTFAYTADITPRNKKRGFLLVVVQGLTHICYGLAHLGSGYFIRETGFLWPLVFAVCLSGVLIIIFIIIVPETMPRGKLSELSPKKSVLRVTAFYTTNKSKSESHRLKFWLCLLAFASLSQSIIGEFGLEVLYELNAPFCWTSVELGHYGAVMSIGIPILTILILKLMQKCLSESLIGFISMVFFMIRSLIRAFSTKTWMLYVCEY
ncbi:solute carrier family 46 member 3-like [Argonauta hians]